MPADRVDAGVEHVALLQRGAECAVESVLKEQLTLPAHDVREQVAEVRGVVVEKVLEVELGLGGGQIIETYLRRRNLSPCALRQPMLGVGTSL
ncbi:MAG: hypothetical protein JWR83_3629 [Aeromicrobium sp.]|nr:hypothetical protein [Aeromicrobium sp.]